MNDDRNVEQQKTHPIAVMGYDNFLSGWGEAAGKASYAAWACTYEEREACEEYVRSRSDMQRVQVIEIDTYRLPANSMLHIYVFDPEINTVQKRSKSSGTGFLRTLGWLQGIEKHGDTRLPHFSRLEEPMD